MKKINAVIFDMDGVISNTVPLHFEVNKKVADEVEIAYTTEWNQQLQGLSRRETVKQIVEKSGKQLTIEEFDQLCEKKNTYYRTLLESLTVSDAQPGMPSFIKSLYEMGMPMVVASASQNASFVLSQLDLLQYFKAVVDVTKLKKGKPDPEIFLKAASLAGVNSDECVAIEDGEPGLTGILQTDMYSVGIGQEEHLKRANAHFLSTQELTIPSLESKLNEKNMTLY
ncbi:beta-phosphoglucomutase [Bacillus suaedae]|uniref:Beta-phosphoglucomutase n=1 Tax=Halalkalibacter suaedae TaxID=2822140 RepID=A0A940X157_9BACI|nr:beta-phosphoglucomutase [Bacillus suaedae]MBP3952734.1 beta-phosphoglucomutase [Bacillus suaedae]